MRDREFKPVALFEKLNKPPRNRIGIEYPTGDVEAETSQPHRSRKRLNQPR